MTCVTGDLCASTKNRLTGILDIRINVNGANHRGFCTTNWRQVGQILSRFSQEVCFYKVGNAGFLRYYLLVLLKTGFAAKKANTNPRIGHKNRGIRPEKWAL